MVLGEAPRCGLERLHGVDVEARGAQLVDRRRQPAARAIRHDGRPVARQLVGLHVVRAHAGQQAVGRERHVTLADPGGDGRLVGRLVLAEARVAKGPEESRLAELVPELGQEGLHGRPDVALVDLLVVEPVGLGVVGLEALVEGERTVRPALERGRHAGLSCVGRTHARHHARRWCGVFREGAGKWAGVQDPGRDRRHRDGRLGAARPDPGPPRMGRRPPRDRCARWPRWRRPRERRGQPPPRTGRRSCWSAGSSWWASSPRRTGCSRPAATSWPGSPPTAWCSTPGPRCSSSPCPACSTSTHRSPS